MKTLRILMLLFISILSVAKIYAQKVSNNSINLNFGGFYISERYTRSSLTTLIGLSYSRRIYKNFFGSFGLNKWQFGRTNFGEDFNVWEPLKITDTAYGTLVRRTNYKMADISAVYVCDIIKGHTISMGLGASYTWGDNTYIKKKPIPVLPLYNDVWYSYENDEAYWGIVPQVSYNYSFLNNRFNIGIDFRARFYRGIQQAQYDYGFHTGVNF